MVKAHVSHLGPVSAQYSAASVDQHVRGLTPPLHVGVQRWGGARVRAAGGESVLLGEPLQRGADSVRFEEAIGLLDRVDALGYLASEVVW